MALSTTQHSRRTRLGTSALASAFVFCLLPACDKGQSESDAAAIASAREAQIRAETELKVMKEVAARAELAESRKVSAPTAADPVTEPAAEPPPVSAPGPSSSAAASACGCKTETCACVTVVVSLNVAARKPGNQDWDALGGGPDPKVTLRTSSVILQSRVFQDLLAATASFPNVALSPGDSIAIDAVDADAMTNDPMGTFSTTYDGRNRTVSGTMAAASIKIEFRK